MITGSYAPISASIVSRNSAIAMHSLVKLVRLSNGKKHRRRCRGCYKKLKNKGYTVNEARKKAKTTNTECNICKETYCLTCFNEVH